MNMKIPFRNGRVLLCLLFVGSVVVSQVPDDFFDNCRSSLEKIFHVAGKHLGQAI